MVEGRNAIYDIRSSTSTDDDLPRSIRALGDELRVIHSKEDPATLTVVVEGAAKTLDPICRDDIYHIVREALRNSFRHAKAEKYRSGGCVWEEIASSANPGTMERASIPNVLDQGGLAGHWGMAGMRERAKRIGGRLVVWSELGAGTEVELSVPGSVVYGPSLPQTAFQSLP